MLCNAILRAIEVGAGEIMLVTHSTNTAAIRLFTKLGFVECSKSKSHNPSFSHVMRLQVHTQYLHSVCLNLEQVLYKHIEKHGKYS